jgi:hypothetical protein
MRKILFPSRVLSQDRRPLTPRGVLVVKMVFARAGPPRQEACRSQFGDNETDFGRETDLHKMTKGEQDG